MHDRRGIRAHRAEGASIRGIARDRGASRNAVRRALADDAALEYARPSMAEEYEPAVSDVLSDWPTLTVAEVAVLVEWPGSRRTLSDLVAHVRERVLERRRDDVDVGRVRAGRVVAGALAVGRMVVGRVRVGREDPQGAP